MALNSVTDTLKRLKALSTRKVRLGVLLLFLSPSVWVLPFSLMKNGDDVSHYMIFLGDKMHVNEKEYGDFRYFNNRAPCSYIMLAQLFLPIEVFGNDRIFTISSFPNPPTSLNYLMG